MSTPVEDVKALIAKAAAAEKPQDAMQFAQAALNATNAISGLNAIQKLD